MAQKLHHQSLNMTIDNKTALLIWLLDLLVVDNELSKAYSIYLCGEKDVRRPGEAMNNELNKTRVKVPQN